MFEVISRDEAKVRGLVRFFTGQPCRNGHVSERLVSNKLCCECRSIVWRDFCDRHPERVLRNRAEQNKRLTETGYFVSHYAKNKQKRKAQAKDWYEANKERALKACQEWTERNREKAREIGRMSRRKRRARLDSVGGTHTYADLDRIYRLQRGKCAICKCSLTNTPKEVDHIVPLALGGHNNASNLQYLCRPCNRAKSAKDPVQFAQERGLLL